MELTFEYWYLFPISVLVAAIVMSSGVGGAVFFSPIFILWLRLEPSVAVGTALIAELFGFSSGVLAYWRQRLIDFRLARALLVFAVPAAIVGSVSTDVFPCHGAEDHLRRRHHLHRGPAIPVLPARGEGES